MLGSLCFILLGMVLWQTSEAPDIAGKWTGEQWGAVVLEAKQSGQYEGSYKDTDHAKSGTVHLKWSRLERRFNGTWEEGDDRNGKISLRLVGDEIRGAWTTDKHFQKESGTPRLADLSVKHSQEESGTPRLADLLWKRGSFSTNESRSAQDSWVAKTKQTELQLKTTTATRKRVHDFTNGSSVRTIAYSADGKLIAVANGNPTFIMNTLQTSWRGMLDDNWKPSAEILDAETGKTVVSLKLTNNDEDAVLAAAKGIAEFGVVINRVPDFEVMALAFSPDGKLLAVGTTVGQVKLFNARTGELVRSLDDEQAKLADQWTPAHLKSLTRAMGGVASLAFSPDGSLLAMCGYSFDEVPFGRKPILKFSMAVSGPGRLKVWEVKTGMLRHDLAGHAHAHAISFSPDGNALASAGTWRTSVDQEGTGVILWNPQTGEKIQTITKEATGHTDTVGFSPSSELVLCGSGNYDRDSDTTTTAVSLAHAGTGMMEWQQTIPGYAHPKAFSPDGKSVVVQCDTQSIRFFDTVTGEAKGEIRAADSFGGRRWLDFAIAPQGHKLAIGGVDNAGKGIVEVWEFDGLGAAATPTVERVPKLREKVENTNKEERKPQAQHGAEWVRDLDEAKELAKASGKDLLIVFTGLGWCLPCKHLDQEGFHAREFVETASKDFNFVEFDSTFGDPPDEQRRADQYQKLQQQFLASSVPTVILADADGVPVAINAGYQTGTGPELALFALGVAQTAKAQRDQFLKNAATLAGDERAEQLHKAISVVDQPLGSIDERGDDPVLTFYKSQVEDILRSASVESALRKKYESRIASAQDWHAREAVFAKLKQFQNSNDYPKAIEYIASALETTTDKNIRWRLEKSRQTYLEWSEKYDEALANSQRLQKLPELSDEDREFLLDREVYNLFNAKRLDEGVAHYDRRIAAAKGDSKKRLSLIRWKAEMVVTHRGPLDKTSQACLEYREAAEPKSEQWWNASYLLAWEYQRAAQHQEAIKLLEELLAIEKQAGCSLTAAESHIALGQFDQAKGHIGDAKNAAVPLARSELKMDRDVAAYVERRSAELEKKMTSHSSKQ